MPPLAARRALIRRADSASLLLPSSPSLLPALEITTPGRAASGEGCAGRETRGDSRASRALALRPLAAASRGQGQERRRKRAANRSGGGQSCPRREPQGALGPRQRPRRRGRVREGLRAGTAAGGDRWHGDTAGGGPWVRARSSSCTFGSRSCPSPRGAEPSPKAKRPTRPPFQRSPGLGAGRGAKGSWTAAHWNLEPKG